MMINKEQIEHLAKLAKLDITEEEKKKYAEQISSILVYFKQLDEVDLSQIDAVDHITGLQNQTRDDEVHHVYSEDEVLASAPEVDGRHVRVKSVFKKD